ncbi:hypothetical protein SAMN05660420_01832, partial [Desulfuromusa kysingii]
GENVGSYTISADALNNSNYDISVVNGELTISARSLTVTADAKNKTAGQSDPALTYQAEVMNGDRGLVTGESLTGSLSRVAGENTGNYEILQGTLTDAENPNYEIDYVAANLTITPDSTPASGSEEQQLENIITDAQQTATQSPANTVMTSPTEFSQASGRGTLQDSNRSNGGLIFVNVSTHQKGSADNGDSDVNGSGGTETAAAGSMLNGGQNNSGYVHVFVVNGGINLSGTGLGTGEDDNSDANQPQIN